jgi:hypothetical protein
MASNRQRFPVLSADAHAALRWLHATGKVTAKDIAGALEKRERLVSEIKQKLEELGGEGLRFLRGPESLKPRAPRRRRRKATAKAQAAWRVQERNSEPSVVSRRRTGGR